MGNIVSSISGALGGGSGFSPNLQTPATEQQAKEQYQNIQNQIANQQAFVNALQGQNGIQNQSNVFNQLGQVAAGQGPNPAQAMLANATGQNAANQAAMMASQRGSGANAGLIARQAAQQGGNLQQQAAGQGAALQAQQSLGALNQMGGIAQQQVSNQNAANAQLGNLALGGHQSVTGALGNYNQQQTQLAAEKAKQQGGILSGLMAGAGTALAGPLGGMISGGMSSLLGNGHSVDQGIRLNELGNADISMAEGGPVSAIGKHFHKMANGGQVPAMVSPGEEYLSPEAVKKVEQGASPMSVGETIPGKPKVDDSKNRYENDTVPKTLEEGGIVIPRSATKSAKPDKAAESFVAAVLARKGKKIQGKK